MFVSNFTGEITEILGGGDTRTVLPGGLNWPLDLAVGDDGRLYVADGTYFYAVAPDGSLQTVGHAVLPGLSRASCAAWRRPVPASSSSRRPAARSPGTGPATSETDYLAAGFDQLYGVAIGPGEMIVFAELGTGRVHALRSGNVETLASGLHDPVGVAFDPDGGAAGRRVGRGPGGDG